MAREDSKGLNCEQSNPHNSYPIFFGFSLLIHPLLEIGASRLFAPPVNTCPLSYVVNSHHERIEGDLGGKKYGVGLLRDS